MSNIFYNYVYLDPRKPGDYNYGKIHFDYEPFTVGKGCYNRMYSHLKEKEETTYNPHKVRIINKIRKAGLEPIILKIFENLNENVAIESEKLLIALIGRYNKNSGPLTNLTDGGEGFSGTVKTEEMLAKCRKIVYQYDLSCNFIKKYKSYKQAELETGIHKTAISECCLGKRYTTGGFMWSNLELTNDEILEKNRNRKTINQSKRVEVYQYGLTGNLIHIYESLTLAKNETGIKNVHCYDNINLTSGGFIWSYKELTVKELNDIIFKVNNKNSGQKCILQFDLNDNFIREFKSLKEASTISGCTNIWDCCNGRAKKSCGYKWKYK